MEDGELYGTYCTCVRKQSLTHIMINRPYSYSRYWTGTSFQLRLMRGIFSNANHMKLFLIIFPRISLHRKLVPVQYQEYEYGVLAAVKKGIRLPVSRGHIAGSHLELIEITCFREVDRWPDDGFLVDRGLKS